MGVLSTDTAAQQAVASKISGTAADQKGTIAAILGEVQANASQFVGEAGSATQVKANQLTEVGNALIAQIDSISERVGQSATSYVGTDSDGAGIISGSAGMAF